MRTRSQPLTRAILDSVHLVDTDHLGCNIHPEPQQPPTGTQPSTDTAPLVDPSTHAVTVCYYGGSGSDRLLASTQLIGDHATQLVDALNAAHPGGNPDLTVSQGQASTTGNPDAVLLVPGPERISANSGRCGYRSDCADRIFADAGAGGEHEVDDVDQIAGVSGSGLAWDGLLPEAGLSDYYTPAGQGLVPSGLDEGVA